MNALGWSIHYKGERVASVRTLGLAYAVIREIGDGAILRWRGGRILWREGDPVRVTDKPLSFKNTVLDRRLRAMNAAYDRTHGAGAAARVHGSRSPAGDPT